jgi:hypothetical protein
VDHKIEDNIDVKCSGSENTEPMYLKKKRLMQNGANCSNRGIEALELAYLKDALMTLSQGDQIVCLLKGRGERFFYQDVDTG